MRSYLVLPVGGTAMNIQESRLYFKHIGLELLPSQEPLMRWKLNVPIGEGWEPHFSTLAELWSFVRVQIAEHLAEVDFAKSLLTIVAKRSHPQWVEVEGWVRNTSSLPPPIVRELQLKMVELPSRLPRQWQKTYQALIKQYGSAEGHLVLPVLKQGMVAIDAQRKTS